MSTFIDIAADIIAVLTVVTYPILCFLFGFAAGMLDSHKQEKKDTSEEVPE